MWSAVPERSSTRTRPAWMDSRIRRFFRQRWLFPEWFHARPPDVVCLDLGHKSAAAEKDLTRRVFFLNAPSAVVLAQSEEHLLLRLQDDRSHAVGDVFSGVPYRICSASFAISFLDGVCDVLSRDIYGAKSPAFTPVPPVAVRSWISCASIRNGISSPRPVHSRIPHPARRVPEGSGGRVSKQGCRLCP